MVISILDLKQPAISVPSQVSIGQNITLRCSADGSYPQPLFRWKIRGHYYSGSTHRFVLLW